MIQVLNKLGIMSASTLAVMLVGVPVASADFVTLWNYEIHSSFSAFTPSWALPGTPNPYMANEPTHLSWGISTGHGPSELSVTDSAHFESSIATNGAAVAGPTMTVLNREITDLTHQTLTQATLHLQTFLNPTAPPDPLTVVPLQQDFWIIFRETSNQDALVLWDPADLNQSLLFGGVTYGLHLTLNGLATLSESQCAEAGASAGCQGLLAPMNDSGVMRTAFSITGDTPVPALQAVPEPSTIVLLASGIAGLLLYGRRKGAVLPLP